MRHQCCSTNWWHIMVKEHFSSKILTALLISITLPPTPSPSTRNSPVDLYDKFYWPIDQSIYTCPLLPTQSVTLCSKEGCMWVLALFVCLFVFFFRTEISKPQFLVFNSKGALWNLRSLTNQPYWWFYCLLHLTLWCKILKNVCSSVKIERPLKHSTQGIMKWNERNWQ